MCERHQVRKSFIWNSCRFEARGTNTCKSVCFYKWLLSSLTSSPHSACVTSIWMFEEYTENTILEGTNIKCLNEECQVSEELRKKKQWEKERRLNVLTNISHSGSDSFSFINVSLSDSPKHLKSFSAFIRHFHPDCVQILVYFNTVHKLTHWQCSWYHLFSNTPTTVRGEYTWHCVCVRVCV